MTNSDRPLSLPIIMENSKVLKMRSLLRRRRNNPGVIRSMVENSVKFYDHQSFIDKNKFGIESAVISLE